MLSAQVTAAGKEDGTDALGQYELLAIPAGDYVVRAERLVLRRDHNQPCPSDGIVTCDRLTASAPVHVDANGTATVDLVLTDESVIVPPTIADKLVILSASVHMVDHEALHANEVKDYVDVHHCVVNPTTPTTTVRLPRTCVGEELSLDLSYECTLDAATGTVTVTPRAVMREDTICGGEVNDREETTVGVPLCTEHVFASCVPTATSLHLLNEERNGGDTIDIDFQFTNYLPNIQPQNWRAVTVFGEGTIHDDDVFGSEEEHFEFGTQCLVDPVNRQSNFSWSKCAGNETVLRVSGTCLIATDEVSVDVNKLKVELFEGISCVTTDLDAHTSREVLLAPCSGGSCPERFQDTIRVENRGDFGTVLLTMSNGQQP